MSLCCGLRRENSPWGYERIVGELAGVGVRVSATTVAKILRQAGVSPAGARTQLSWRDFLRADADSIIACDFVTFAHVIVTWPAALDAYADTSSDALPEAGASARASAG